MKIGILTYHRSHNYGALLQAVALRSILEKDGNDVRYIDYWPKYHAIMYGLFNPSEFRHRRGIVSKLKYLLLFCIGSPKRIKIIKEFTKFINEYIEPYCSPYSTTDEYDLIVYGSDQIWRKQAGLGGKFNPVYFGDNILRTSKSISYAASMGCVNLSSEDRDFLKENLSRFDKISVREDETANILAGCGVNNISIVSDPTLLFCAAHWDKLVPVNSHNIKKNYVLYYKLLSDSFKDEQVAQFARERGLSLITIRGGVVDIYSRYKIVGPSGFLSLVKNAEFVFTSSYHGLIFSIIYRKQFYASFGVNANRAKSILKYLGLEQHLLDANSALPTFYPDIDYDKVENALNKLKNRSIQYLQSCLLM